MKRLGYVRLSKEEEGSMSVENQIGDLLGHDPDMLLFVDSGVSGETNLVRTDGAWAKLWSEFLKDPTETEICVVAFDRMAESKGRCFPLWKMSLTWAVPLSWYGMASATTRTRMGQPRTLP